jgi:hypothetical protein
LPYNQRACIAIAAPFQGARAAEAARDEASG